MLLRMTANQQPELPQRRITITLSGEEHYLLRLLAFDQDIPLAQMAREGLQSYLQQADAAGTFKELAANASGITPAAIRDALARLEADVAAEEI